MIAIPSRKQALSVSPTPAGAVASVSTTAADPEWDAFVDGAPGGHHLQTSRWAKVKARQGWRAVRLQLRREGELVGGCQLLIRNARFGSIAYCPRGPVTLDHDRPTTAAVLDMLGPVALQGRILYLKVQPAAGHDYVERLLRERGFVRSDLPAAPAATVNVRLDRNLDEILAGMRASTRSNIRQAQRKGAVVVEVGARGLPAFGELVAATSARKSFSPYPLSYYSEILDQFAVDGRAELFLVQDAGEVLSGAVVIAWGDTVVYKMSAWSGRSPKLHPNELMVWHVIQWGRERGYRFLDMEGIREPVARAKLAGEELPAGEHLGTSEFKLGLGGEVTLYPQAYDRSFHPLLRWPARLLAPRLERFTSLAHQMLGRGRAGSDQRLSREDRGRMVHNSPVTK